MDKYSQKRQNSLAERLKAGDHTAAAELVDIYYDQIYLFMRRLGHGRQESFDLTQDTFLQAWRHIAQLRNSTALNAWLYRIAGNTSKLYWRRHRFARPTSIEDLDVPDSSQPDNDRIERIEQLDHLKNAIAKLSEKSRQAVVLHYMQHLTIAEAAEAAGIGQNAFKGRLSRALKALRNQIGSQNGGP